jgi:O-antigen/teichoic acid export membrane protein
LASGAVPGVYLLTSIGLNITKQTLLSGRHVDCVAATSVGANLILIPRFGAIGAAWANALAYATLAVVAMRLSQRFYPIRYEWARIARIAVAGVVSWGLSMLLVPGGLRPLWGLLAHGTMVLGCYPVLFAMGFYQARSWRFSAKSWAGSAVASRR